MQSEEIIEWKISDSELPDIGVRVMAFRADCGVFIAIRNKCITGYSVDLIEDLLEKGLLSDSVLDEVLWFDDERICNVTMNPTHWMPLPDTPVMPKGL